MERSDYPALYAAADESSVEAQKWTLGLIIIYSILLVAATALNVLAAISPLTALLSGVLIAISGISRLTYHGP